MQRIALNPPIHSIWEGIFTPREAEVVELVAQGYSDPEIAKEMYLSVGTIKWHQTSARRKIEAANRVVLARWWWANVERPGLLEVATLEIAA
jgi:DNA-binding CsgD family transcriptional regulator